MQEKKIGSSNIIIEAQASGREKASVTVPIQIKERPITTLTLSSQSGEVKQDETISITAETNADSIEAQINNSNAQISVSGKTINITGKNVGSSIITVTACIPNSIPVTRQYNLNIKINKYLNALAYATVNGYKTIGQAFILENVNWTLVNWNWSNNNIPVTLKIYVNNRLSQTVECSYFTVDKRFSDKPGISVGYSFKAESWGWLANAIITERTSMTDLVVFSR